MKTLALYTVSSLLFLSSCTSITMTTGKLKLPPGQAKKVDGSQSAKSYAPGQQKKMNGDKSAKKYAPGQQKKHKHKH